jgi:predicted phosphate transport protein (TIGR00153 family)
MAKFTFIPKEKKFFDLFEANIANALKVAEELKELVESWEYLATKASLIDDLEHEGDHFTHQIMALLHRTFITPFDREDIAALANAMDDVVDFMHAAVMAMEMYKVEKPSPRAKELAMILVAAVKELQLALGLLRNSSRLRDMLPHCVEVNRLENAADTIFRSAMMELFENSTDFAYVIKWREIYEHLETATDRCEDVANVLEGIALKHA